MMVNNSTKTNQATTSHLKLWNTKRQPHMALEI